MSGHRVQSKRRTVHRKSKYLPHDTVLAYHLLADLYKLQGLNTKGRTPLVGWENARQGLSEDPILDPDYVFESEHRLSQHDLWNLGIHARYNHVRFRSG